MLSCDLYKTYNFVSVCIVVYADDILLQAPSLAALQQLVSLFEFNLQLLDLAININKSLYPDWPAFQYRAPTLSSLTEALCIGWTHYVISEYLLCVPDLSNVCYFMLSNLSSVHLMLYMVK